MMYRRALLALPLLILVAPGLARPQAPGSDAGPAMAEHPTQMRPAVMYSCMTMPPDGPPMVDSAVPRAIERLAPGWGIMRYAAEPWPAGWSLWRIIGGPRRAGQSERISYVMAWDGTRVLEGPRLFVALGVASTSPRHLAVRALAVLFRRAEELPLGTRDNADAAPTVRGRIADPMIRDGRLVFWARSEPGTSYAHEVEVDLATGRVEHGNVW